MPTSEQKKACGCGLEHFHTSTVFHTSYDSSNCQRHAAVTHTYTHAHTYSKDIEPLCGHTLTYACIETMREQTKTIITKCKRKETLVHTTCRRITNTYVVIQRSICVNLSRWLVATYANALLEHLLLLLHGKGQRNRHPT